MDSPADHICLAFIFKFSMRDAVKFPKRCAYGDEETSHSAHSLLHSHFMSKLKPSHGIAVWGQKWEIGSMANICPPDCGACFCMF